MQRRWAAISLAFFLVMAAGAYSVMVVADEPGLDVEGETFWQEESVELGGTEYTFATIDDGEATIEYEETVESETVFENGSTVAYEDGEYSVVIESGEEPSSFDLVETFDVEAMLADDPDVENETITREDEQEYVVYRNGTTERLDEYLPEPDRQTRAEGSTLEHENVTKTVDSITSDAATLHYDEVVSQSMSVEEGDVVTFAGEDYVITFVDADTVMLSPDVEGYETAVDNQEYFDMRLSGLMYVVLFSLGAVFLLTVSAFLPRRG